MMETKQSYRIAGKKILVTGATGFIGSHLCHRLIANGAELHAVSRTTHLNDGSEIQWWQGDLANVETVRRLFLAIKPDVVYHLASYVMGAPDIVNVLPTFHSNLQTTVNLLTMAAEIGCHRMILTGSLAEPEEGDPGAAVPSSPYAAAKSASSAYARMFYALYDLPVVMLRVFMVYGPGQKDLSKLIPYVTLTSLQGETPRITSGERLIDWIYVDDVVDGFITAAEAPGIEGQTIDLGSGKLISIREIVQLLFTLMGGATEPLFGALHDRPLEPTRVADIANTQAKLGWKPKYSLKEGLLHTIDWYRTQMSSLLTTRDSI